MPVQINEMVIKANITEGKEKEKVSKPDSGEAAQEDLIRECVDRVMQVLAEKNAR